MTIQRNKMFNTDSLNKKNFLILPQQVSIKLIIISQSGGQDYLSLSKKTHLLNKVRRRFQSDEQRPYNVIHAVDTSQEGFDVKLPSSKTIKRYKELFHTKRKLKSKDKRKSLVRSKKSGAVDFIRKMIRRDRSLGKSIKDDASPKGGRFFVYKYDQDNRLPMIESNNENLQPFETIPILPLNPVSDKIKDGKFYVVEELIFSYTTKEHGAINWIALVELETESVPLFASFGS